MAAVAVGAHHSDFAPREPLHLVTRTEMRVTNEMMIL